MFHMQNEKQSQVLKSQQNNALEGLEKSDQKSDSTAGARRWLIDMQTKCSRMRA